MEHEYLMEAEQYFGGKYRFQVNAENREEAMAKGEEHLRTGLNRDNIIRGTLRVVRKLKPQFGKQRKE